jgi:hypothetical protein
MTTEDHAIWQADIADRERYEIELAMVHLSVNYESDRALGTFDETIEMQGEVK